MILVGGDSVAPHAGAWIETAATVVHGKAVKSPPMRGRGLKLRLLLNKRQLYRLVAPHAGAWIETALRTPTIGAL